MADYLRDVLGRQRVTVLQASPISLPNGSEPPDIAIVRPLGEAYLGRHPYPGDVLWVIEFANTSLAKDLEDKRRVYAVANLQEHWVINLQTMQMIVFRQPERGEYTSW